MVLSFFHGLSLYYSWSFRRCHQGRRFLKELTNGNVMGVFGGRLAKSQLPLHLSVMATPCHLPSRGGLRRCSIQGLPLRGAVSRRLTERCCRSTLWESLRESLPPPQARPKAAPAGAVFVTPKIPWDPPVRRPGTLQSAHGARRPPPEGRWCPQFPAFARR